jgi:hypothetical protein
LIWRTLQTPKTPESSGLSATIPLMLDIETSTAVVDDQQKTLERTIAFRVSASEHETIARLARQHDRTPASEVRRAMRYYLANFKSVDRALRRQAGATP